VMSNFNREIDRKLKLGNCYAGYPAWNFYGEVWYENNQFHCEIWRYHCHIDTISVDTLEEIMEEASENYGWD